MSSLNQRGEFFLDLFIIYYCPLDSIVMLCSDTVKKWSRRNMRITRKKTGLILSK